MSDALRKAAEQAVEALEPHLCQGLPCIEQAAHDALLAALAEPTEPAAEWLTGCPECGIDGGCDCPSGTDNTPQREPRAWIDRWGNYAHPTLQDTTGATPLYTRPEAPPLKPLADADIDAACAGIECSNIDLGVYDRLIARAAVAAFCRVNGISAPPSEGER